MYLWTLSACNKSIAENLFKLLLISWVSQRLKVLLKVEATSNCQNAAQTNVFIELETKHKVSARKMQPKWQLNSFDLLKQLHSLSFMFLEICGIYMSNKLFLFLKAKSCHPNSFLEMNPFMDNNLAVPTWRHIPLALWYSTSLKFYPLVATPSDHSIYCPFCHPPMTGSNLLNMCKSNYFYFIHPQGHSI